VVNDVRMYVVVEDEFIGYVACRTVCCPSVPCQIYFFHSARILNRFRWNSRELIMTTNRLNGYILGEIGTGTRERDTREYLNRRQSVVSLQFAGCVAVVDGWKCSVQWLVIQRLTAQSTALRPCHALPNRQLHRPATSRRSTLHSSKSACGYRDVLK